MRALVIAGANIKHMPYLFEYFEQLMLLKYEVTLFYWDRDGQIDRALPQGIKTICFKKIMGNDISKFAKIKNFLQYRIKAVNNINSTQYDRIIVCDTQFAILLSDILLGKYKKRYIFDYRDPSYEYIGVYKKRVHALVLNSKATFISSEAYREYLPKCEHIFTTHNISKEDLRYRDVRREHSRDADIIRIIFWGCIRDTEANLILIKGLANDLRFELHYYGTIGKTARTIIDFCKRQNIFNVFVHQAYLPDERYGFAATTDMIHNMYNNNSTGGNPSMGNKFYDGIIFYIPQICINGGYMGKQVEKNEIGVLIDYSTAIAEKLYNYYKNIDWEDFERKCDSCLASILEEQKASVLMLRKALQ